MSKTPNELTKFIKTTLKAELDRDFQRAPFRIFREADLHACCYFHLRKSIGDEPDWEICNEPFLKGLKGRNRGAQPDIVLFYKEKPVALIELKFRKRGDRIQRKDRWVLRRAVKSGKKFRRWVKKAFYIEVAPRPKEKLRKNIVKYRNRVISLPMSPKILPSYLEKYRRRHKPERRRKHAT